MNHYTTYQIKDATEFRKLARKWKGRITEGFALRSHCSAQIKCLYRSGEELLAAMNGWSRQKRDAYFASPVWIFPNGDFKLLNNDPVPGIHKMPWR